MAHNIRTVVRGDPQIEKLRAESLNDLELGDAHTSAFYRRISTKVSV